MQESTYKSPDKSKKRVLCRHMLTVPSYLLKSATTSWTCFRKKTSMCLTRLSDRLVTLKYLTQCILLPKRENSESDT